MWARGRLFSGASRGKHGNGKSLQPPGRVACAVVKEVNGKCGNKQRPPKGEKAKATDSELAIARGSATIICIWQRLKGRQRSGKASWGGKGDLRCALTGGCWPGELEVG